MDAVFDTIHNVLHLRRSRYTQILQSLQGADTATGQIVAVDNLVLAVTPICSVLAIGSYEVGSWYRVCMLLLDHENELCLVARRVLRRLGIAPLETYCAGSDVYEIGPDVQARLVRFRSMEKYLREHARRWREFHGLAGAAGSMERKLDRDEKLSERDHRTVQPDTRDASSELVRSVEKRQHLLDENFDWVEDSWQPKRRYKPKRCNRMGFRAPRRYLVEPEVSIADLTEYGLEDYRALIDWMMLKIPLTNAVRLHQKLRLFRDDLATIAREYEVHIPSILQDEERSVVETAIMLCDELDERAEKPRDARIGHTRLIHEEADEESDSTTSIEGGIDESGEGDLVESGDAGADESPQTGTSRCTDFQYRKLEGRNQLLVNIGAVVEHAVAEYDSLGPIDEDEDAVEMHHRRLTWGAISLAIREFGEYDPDIRNRVLSAAREYIHHITHGDADAASTGARSALADVERNLGRRFVRRVHDFLRRQQRCPSSTQISDEDEGVMYGDEIDEAFADFMDTTKAHLSHRRRLFTRSNYERARLHREVTLIILDGFFDVLRYYNHDVYTYLVTEIGMELFLGAHESMPEVHTIRHNMIYDRSVRWVREEIEPHIPHSMFRDGYRGEKKAGGRPMFPGHELDTYSQEEADRLRRHRNVSVESSDEGYGSEESEDDLETLERKTRMPVRDRKHRRLKRIGG